MERGREMGAWVSKYQKEKIVLLDIREGIKGKNKNIKGKLPTLIFAQYGAWALRFIRKNIWKAEVGVEGVMFFSFFTLSSSMSHIFHLKVYLFVSKFSIWYGEWARNHLQETYTCLNCASPQVYWKDMWESQGNNMLAVYLVSVDSKAVRQPLCTFVFVAISHLCFSWHICLGFLFLTYFYFLSLLLRVLHRVLTTPLSVSKGYRVSGNRSTNELVCLVFNLFS